MPRPIEKPNGVYLRVSTKDQRHDSQRSTIESWLEREGIDPARVEWYVDTESGRRMDRIEFARLNGDVQRLSTRTVVVYKLNRIARDMLGGLEVLTMWLRHGARVVSVTEPIDLRGPTGKIVAAVLLGLAEIEWEQRREAQRDGIREAKARGVYTGRRPGTLKADADRARELAAKGLRATEVAEALGISRRTVYNYLRLGSD